MLVQQLQEQLYCVPMALYTAVLLYFSKILIMQGRTM